MSLGFACPHCGRTTTFRSRAGFSVACEHCGETVDFASIRHGFTRPPALSAPYHRQIGRHIRRTIGESTMVFHELLPNGLPLDIHVVPPQGSAQSPEYPFGRHHFTLVTSGMSTCAMMCDVGHVRRYAELMLALPANWKGLRPDGTLDATAMEREENWWPIQWLKHIARIPQETRGGLGRGDVLPRERMDKTLSPETQLTHLLVGPSRLHPRSESLMVHDDISIEFCALWPLHADEADYKARCGAEALQAELDRERMTELVDVTRAGVLHPVVQRA